MKIKKPPTMMNGLNVSPTKVANVTVTSGSANKNELVIAGPILFIVYSQM